MQRFFKTGLVTCLAIIFSLVLYGCGGGGSSGPAAPVEPEPPMPPAVTPSVDLMGLDVPADDYMIAAGETMDVGEGESEVTLSCSAAADCSFTVAEDGMATATSGEATAALSEAAKQAIANRQNMAAQAKIMGLTVAIADPDGDGTPGGDLQKSDRPGGATSMVSTALGGVVSYGTDKLGVDDKTADGESVDGQFGDPTDAAAIPGWTGTTQGKTADNVMTELVVYSDAEDPKNQAYMMFFGASNAADATPIPDNPRPTIVSAIDVPDGDDDPTNDNAIKDGTLTLAGTNTADLDDEAALFGGSIFEFTGTTQTVPGADDGTTDNAKENERAGTFAGVPGTFVCGAGAGAVCTLTKDAKGKLMGIGAGWTFRPDGTASNIKVQDVIKDADYLAYGYWLETTTKADGSMTYGVNVFATGSKLFATGSIEALVKTATYTGNATGLYTEKDFSTGAGIPAAAGQFTADAKLTAMFGGDDVPVNDKYTISGTVNNFRNTDGDMISGGAWSVNLSKSDFSGRAAGVVDGTPGTTFANTFGGSTTGGGSWTGMFYGPVTADDTTTGDVNEAITGYPSGVAGEFNAHFGNGHVIGAFGATR